MASAREDGRGHWPGGVPRHPLAPGVMRKLRAAARGHSYRSIATALGTDHGSVGRWLRGVQNPAGYLQHRILTRL